MMKISVQVTLILVSSTLIGIGYNQFRQQPLTLLYESISLEPGSFIDTERAFSLFSQREALFIDARSTEAFQKGHISAAINIPVKWSRSSKIEILQRVPKDANIVVYCDNAYCTSAERLAGELKFMGYKHVAVFVDGWIAWQSINTSGK